MGAVGLGHLYGEAAHAARGAEDEDALAGLDLRAVPYRVEGGARGDGHGGGLFEAEGGRLGREGALLGAGVLGERSGAVAVHLVARPEAGDVRADGFDHPRDVQAADARLGSPQARHGADRVGQARHEVPDALVEAGRVHPYEDLAPARNRPVYLFDAQDLGRSVDVLDDGLHASSPSVEVYWNTVSSGTANTRAISNAFSREGE